jgi:hypothetical protein
MGAAPMMRRATLVAVTLLLALALSRPAQGALPPAFGGVAVLPADGALARPLPGDALTPLQAALEAAVYDTLYLTEPSGRTLPLLALDNPVREQGELRVTLRDGLRVHGGATLTATHVAQSLEAARTGRHSWLMAGVASVRADGPLVVAFRTRLSARELSHRLSAAPLAIVAQQAVPRGTGPFVVDVQPNGHLRLRGVRFAPRGAPYLREVQVVAARSSSDELRAFELGELHASFAAGRDGAFVRAGRYAPVLLIPNRAGGALASAAVRAAVEGALDRPRLERVGMALGARLAPNLPAWQHQGAGTARASGPLRILVAAEDPFERRVADAWPRSWTRVASAWRWSSAGAASWPTACVEACGTCGWPRCSRRWPPIAPSRRRRSRPQGSSSARATLAERGLRVGSDPGSPTWPPGCWAGAIMGCATAPRCWAWASTRSAGCAWTRSIARARCCDEEPACASLAGLRAGGLAAHGGGRACWPSAASRPARESRMRASWTRAPRPGAGCWRAAPAT